MIGCRKLRSVGCRAFWAHRFALSDAVSTGHSKVWASGYGLTIRALLRITVIVMLLYGGLLALTAQQFASAPQGFIPNQDQGYLIAVVQLPPGASLERTDAVVTEAEQKLLEVEGVAHTVGFSGLDGATLTLAPNAGAIFVVLDPFEDRHAEELSAGAILGRAFGAMQPIMDANIFLIAPPPVRGIGNAGGWKLYVQDVRGRGIEALQAAVGQAAGAANTAPELAAVFSLFNTSTPKLYADIDRVKAQQIGVQPEQIFETLEVYLGSAFVNDFNFLGRTYRVTVDAFPRLGSLFFPHVHWPFRSMPWVNIKLRPALR